MLFPSKVNDYIVQYVLAIIVPYPISTSGIILLYQKCTPPQKNNQKQRAKIKNKSAPKNNPYNFCRAHN